jgi:hypothetical protein
VALDEPPRTPEPVREVPTTPLPLAPVDWFVPLTAIVFDIEFAAPLSSVGGISPDTPMALMDFPYTPKALLLRPCTPVKEFPTPRRLPLILG